MSKTLQEERKIVQEETALLRLSLLPDQTFPSENYLKLIAMSLLGYPLELANMHCIKSFSVSSNFRDKKILSLALSLLIPYPSEILLLVTGSIIHDLRSKNTKILILALTLAANIACQSEIISSSLAPYVSNLLKHQVLEVQKRAAVCMCAIIKTTSCLEASLVPNIHSMLEPVNLKSLKITLDLIFEAIKVDPSLKESFQTSYTNVSKRWLDAIKDPFLLVNIVKFIGMYPITNRVKELAVMALSRDTNKAVALEVAVFALNSPSVDLQNKANSMVSRMIAFYDFNSTYATLRALDKVQNLDVIRVHLFKILRLASCPDLSILKSSIELAFKLVNQENVKEVIDHYLECLDDKRVNDLIMDKISVILKMYTLEQRWNFEIGLKLCLNWKDVSEEIIYLCINSTKNDEEIQEYATKKVIEEFEKGNRQAPLVQVGLWIIGHYNTNVDTGLIKSVLLEINPQELSEENLGVLCTCLLKVGMSNECLTDDILHIFDELAFNQFVEVQQRACEYREILLKYKHLLLK